MKDILKMRVDTKEKQSLNNEAKRLGLSLSAYIRMILIKRNDNGKKQKAV